MTAPAKLALEAIREHLVDVEREYDQNLRSHDQLASEVRRLADANRTLVEALLAVEWIHEGTREWGEKRALTNLYRCPWCDASREVTVRILREDCGANGDHRPDCPREMALQKAGIR